MKTRRQNVKSTALPGGPFKLADDLVVTRMGYGAMQLAGPYVFGPPADHDSALAVLREVVRLGINHIDTSDFYGPHITNQLTKEALHPYPEQLRIVTKVGTRKGIGRERSHPTSSGKLLMITSQTSGSTPLMWSTCGLVAWTRRRQARSRNRSACSRKCRE